MLLHSCLLFTFHPQQIRGVLRPAHISGDNLSNIETQGHWDLLGHICKTMHSKVFQVLTKCQGHHCMGNNQVPSIKTSSSVVEVVKLMPWRQAKSPLKIPSWSGGKKSSSYIFYNWHPPDQEGNFKGEVTCLQGINLTTSNNEDDVFMDGTWLLPVQWCPWHLVNTWNTLVAIKQIKIQPFENNFHTCVNYRS